MYQALFVGVGLSPLPAGHGVFSVRYVFFIQFFNIRMYIWRYEGTLAPSVTLALPPPTGITVTCWLVRSARDRMTVVTFGHVL